MAEEEPRPDPSLTNVLASKSLRWVFVGGKGGVGKTTTSCALACQLATVRRSVLLISTDPAHNLSDAFRQKFTRAPTAVQGVDNLFAMEVDPTPDPEELEAIAGGIDGATGGAGGGAASFLGDLASSIPGIDEAMSFAEVMRQVQSLDYETIVFVTAPTGKFFYYRVLSPHVFEERETEKRQKREKTKPFLSLPQKNTKKH